jgi:glucose-6-phosphate isomerase
MTTRKSLRAAQQALFNTGNVLDVDRELVEHLKGEARRSPTRRFRLCLHHSPDDVVQEMIIVHCRDNYSRPHRHPVATTVVILEGELTVLVFDGDGRVEQTIELGPLGSGKPFSLRLEGAVWHMPICRSEQLVFFETMQGPFRRDDANQWAPWSPAEDDAGGIEAYFRRLGVDRD